MAQLLIHDVKDRPSIFHITAHKCASQWIAEILKYCAYRRVVMPQRFSNHFLEPGLTLVQGLIYPTLYIKRSAFERVLQRNQHIAGHRLFLVTRDLRDLLISLYYSVLYSHKLGFGPVDRGRVVLEEIPMEEGLCYLMNTELIKEEAILGSWIDPEIQVFKFEDLIADEKQMIAKILDFCEIEVADDHFELVMQNNSFKSLSGGRDAGEEDQSSHYRKGVAGDWRNHFTERVKDEFKQRFNSTLVAMGYEQSDDW